MTILATTDALRSGVNPVHFTSRGVRLAGDLCRPDGFDASTAHPTIVYSGPFNQAKEQTGAVHVEFLTQHGTAEGSS